MSIRISSWRRAITVAAAGLAGLVLAVPAASAASAPVGPASVTAVHFPGLPQVGALFDAPDYTGPDAAHFCTGSVIDSHGRDLVLTAAHCVWSAKKQAYTHPSITFAPDYDNQPNATLGGVWNVQSVAVAPGYIASGNPVDDYAILTIAPRNGWNIQDFTGGLKLSTTRLPEPVAVVGYNNLQWDTQGNEPIICLAIAFEETDAATPWSRFNCSNYQDGTSGGPWIVTGTDKVVGVIGGYEQGGDSPDWSYSTIFNQDTIAFYHSVEH